MQGFHFLNSLVENVPILIISEQNNEYTIITKQMMLYSHTILITVSIITLGADIQQFSIIQNFKPNFKPNFGKSTKINVVTHNAEELPIARVEKITNEDLAIYCKENLKPMFSNSEGFKIALCVKDGDGYV